MARITLEFDVDDSVPLDEVYIVAGNLAALDDYDTSLIRIADIYVDNDYGKDKKSDAADFSEEKSAKTKAMWDWAYSTAPDPAAYTTTNHVNMNTDTTADLIAKGIQEMQALWKSRNVR